MSTQPAMEPAPPTAFDGFEIVRPLGAGGMGAVYAAREAGLGRLVAIKFVASSDNDARARERFSCEARALARLQHPNVVSLFRIGDVGGRPYLVCELIAGRRLDELTLPIPWRDALRIGLGLARAIAAAHRCGVLHRDIKPSNVMLTDDGLVKLLDFGLAVLTDDVAADAPTTPVAAATPHRPDRFTESGSVAGTPRYMAPELWTGAAPTRQTDLYALGLVLHELMFGTLPGAVIADRTHLPRPLARLVDACVRAEPRDRPPSASYVRDELERLARGFPGTGRARRALPSDAGRTATMRNLIGELLTLDGAKVEVEIRAEPAPTAVGSRRPR
jgi:serine/threonine protein kinase